MAKAKLYIAVVSSTLPYQSSSICCLHMSNKLKIYISIKNREIELMFRMIHVL